MLKSLVVAGTTALVIGTAGLAHAQQGPRAHHTPRVTAEDVTALADARIAGLKAGLRLTAEQEKHWPAYEAAIRERAQQRADRLAKRQEIRAERRAARAEGKETRAERRQARAESRDERQRPDAIQRLRRGADGMTTRAAAMTGLADAAEPLYQSLDDDQKRRFAMLTRIGVRQGAGPARHHWRGGHR